MAWPTQQASTQHLDQPSDSVLASRQDIKQNLDNVNSIIEQFSITTPSQGDVFVADSAGVFANTPTLTADDMMAWIVIDGGEIYDPFNIISSVDTAGQTISLPHGTYFVQSGDALTISTVDSATPSLDISSDRLIRRAS